MAVNLITLARSLPKEWQGQRAGGIAETAVKVFRMEGSPLPEECHPDYTEIFIVLEGVMHLVVNGEPETLRAGDMRYIPPSTPHSVLAGSRGILMILDDEPTDS